MFSSESAAASCAASRVDKQLNLLPEEINSVNKNFLLGWRVKILWKSKEFTIFANKIIEE